MKKIDKQFTRGGFYHKQLKRTGDVALYERSGLDHSTSHYEVVKISRHNGYKMNGSYIKPAETYPGASLWGIQGWTYQTLDRANERFDAACERFNNKERVEA